MKPIMAKPEASDSPSRSRPGQTAPESPVLSVFKMTKGCVMLKVKRHVSILLKVYHIDLLSIE